MSNKLTRHEEQQSSLDLQTSCQYSCSVHLSKHWLLPIKDSMKTDDSVYQSPSHSVSKRKGLHKPKVVFFFQ